MTYAQTIIDARMDLRRRAALELCGEIVVSGMMGISAAALLVVAAVLMIVPIAAMYAMRAW